MDIQDKKIGIIGTGNMGETLIEGLISFANLNPHNIFASDIDQKKLKKIQAKYAIEVSKDNKQLLKKVDIVIIAVKPQNINEVLKEISEQDKLQDAIISIAAGIETSFIESSIRKEIPVIRVMPNICATVNAAVSAISGGKYSTGEALQIVKEIFESIGKVVETNEALMDVVTGLSGSGPAYIFLAIEALTDAGVNLGLSREVSTVLAAQTTLGAAKMVLETGKDPRALKDMVTSPGGTTIQGIHVLERYNFQTALIDAVKAATERSKELRRQK